MPYSRKPIQITTNSTVDEIRVELNATITKLNELFNALNELEPAPNPVFHNVTLSGGLANDVILESGIVRQTVIEDSVIGLSNTVDISFDDKSANNFTLDNSTLTNSTLTNNTILQSSFDTVTIKDSNVQGYDAALDETHAVASHTQGSTTIELTSISDSLDDYDFWYDGREYTVQSTDVSLNTVTVYEVESDVTFSGNLTFRSGDRTTIRNPYIFEPTYSGIVHMDGDLMNMIIKHGSTTKREDLGLGTEYELFFDNVEERLYIYDGVSNGGVPIGLSLTESDSRYLNQADNLSDLPDVSVARSNIDLGVNDNVNFARVDEQTTVVSTTPYTITDDSNNIFVIETTSGDMTINLPTLADNVGRKIFLINMNVENKIIINSEAGDVIGAEGETTVTVPLSVTTTILVATGTYWEQVSTGGGGASITPHIAGMTVTRNQPLAISQGTQEVALEIPTSPDSTAFDDPVTAYVVLSLASDIRLMIYFVTDSATPAPELGQTHEIQVLDETGYASYTDVIAAAEEQLIGQFGIVNAGSGSLAEHLYLTFSIPDTNTLSFSATGSFWLSTTTVVTPSLDTLGKVVVADKRYRYVSDVVGLCTVNGAYNDDTGAQKVALFDEADSAIVGTLDVGVSLFLGNGGTIIQDASEILLEEYRVFLGIAISSTTLDVLIQEPVAISNSPQYWDAVPLGSIIFDTVGTLPEGFLRPNGQAISRSSYSELNAKYASEGYPYGDGDGSTTFNIPDYSDPTLMIKVRYVDSRTVTEQNDFETRLLAQEGTTGTSFPSEPLFGEMFYRTDTDGWYKYNGSTWIEL